MRKILKKEAKNLQRGIRMNKTVGLVMFLLLLTSFREPEYCKVSDRIVAGYIKEFTKPKGLFVCGSGGAMANNIQQISLSFASFAALDVDEARILYVEMVEELLRRINANRAIRPFLHNYPFEEKNIDLMISFKDSKLERVSANHVALMSIGKDHMIFYAAYDHDKKKFYDLYEENYVEARDRVKNLKEYKNGL
jgi:hypothetical protein